MTRLDRIKIDLENDMPGIDDIEWLIARVHKLEKEKEALWYAKEALWNANEQYNDAFCEFKKRFPVQFHEIWKKEKD